MSNISTITTAEVDARLYRDTIEHERKIENIFVICYVVFFIIFFNAITYWIKFGVAIPTKFGKTPIITSYEPIQRNYSINQQLNKKFIYTSLINNHKITITPQAYYKMSALVVAYNHDFLFISDFFDSAALYDIGTTWGKLGNKTFYDKYFESYSTKNEVSGTRYLQTRVTKDFLMDEPMNIEEAQRSFAHSHLVPANKNVMAALLKIKKWDKVIIEGYLIDMDYQNQTYKTSMSRTDVMPGDRGNGNCETIYVKSVQIGNLVYQ